MCADDELHERRDRRDSSAGWSTSRWWSATAPGVSGSSSRSPTTAGRDSTTGVTATRVRDRHAAYFAEVAERSYLDWRTAGGHDQAWWLACLTGELDNVRAALEWSIARGDANHRPTDRRSSGLVLVEHRTRRRGAWLGRAGAGVPGVAAPAGCAASGDRARRGSRSRPATSTLRRRTRPRRSRSASRSPTTRRSGIAWALSAQLALLDGRSPRARSAGPRAAGERVGERRRGTRASPPRRGRGPVIAGRARGRGARGGGRHRHLSVRRRHLQSRVDAGHARPSGCRRAAGSRRPRRPSREAHDVCVTFGLRGWQITHVCPARFARAGAPRPRAWRTSCTDGVVDLARELALPAAEARRARRPRGRPSPRR